MLAFTWPSIAIFLLCRAAAFATVHTPWPSIVIFLLYCKVNFVAAHASSYQNNQQRSIFQVAFSSMSVRTHDGHRLHNFAATNLTEYLVKSIHQSKVFFRESLIDF